MLRVYRGVFTVASYIMIPEEPVITHGHHHGFYHAEMQKEVATVTNISNILPVKLLSRIHYGNVYKYLLM